MERAPRLERAVGRLDLTVSPAGVGRLREEGCLKLRFPKHAGAFEAVLINTAGGIAGGDQLATAITLEPGAAAVATSQAAERVYRARAEDESARWTTDLALSAAAQLDWLPQELILFEGAALRRRLTLRLAENACFTGAEMVVLGRTASGERITRLRFDDLVRIERNGTLLLHDATRLTDEAFRAQASLGGMAGFATLLHVAPDAEARIPALREALPPRDAGATSPVAGLIVARILATDGATLRRHVLRALDILRDGRHPPRVWQC